VAGGFCLVISSASTEAFRHLELVFSKRWNLKFNITTSKMPLPFWTLGCIYGASSVTLGAFGAHGLKKKIADPARIANWNTAAHYQVLSSSPLTPSITLANFPTFLSLP